MFLGLDLSLTSTGVCALVDSTCAETRAFQNPSMTGMPRVNAILKGLDTFISEFGGSDSFELACIEGYAYGGTGRTFHLAELGGLVRWHLDYVWKVPYIVADPQELKKFISGNGRADKVQMGQVMQLVYDRDFLKTDWPGRLKSKPKPEDWGAKDEHWRNDEADAFGLANVAALYHGAWDRVPTIDQLSIIEQIKLDPMGILSKAAQERAAKKVKK